ncbi:MAG: hypothetical protein J7L73_00490 [Anaerolineales bacterium]|nr:hypothetical protein [Anaerolineales bacterium]
MVTATEQQALSFYGQILGLFYCILYGGFNTINHFYFDVWLLKKVPDLRTVWSGI